MGRSIECIMHSMSRVFLFTTLIFQITFFIYIYKGHSSKQVICLYIIDQIIRKKCKGIYRNITSICNENIFIHLSFVEYWKKFKILFKRNPRTTFLNIFKISYFFIYIISLKLSHTIGISQINYVTRYYY